MYSDKSPVMLLGIGVPIMLAYVYGVVPISLCRGGGCGVSRGKGRGVRIDFDEDDGPITGNSMCCNVTYRNKSNILLFINNALSCCVCFFMFNASLLPFLFLLL